MGNEGARRAFLKEVVGRDLLSRADRTLLAAGIPWMPLKGIWLHLEGVYSSFLERPMSDIDILVPTGRYDESRRVLRAAGFSETKALPGECTLVLDRDGFGLDLHRTLFVPACFELGTAEMFARSQSTRVQDGLSFSPPLPLDGFAHLIGHFVRGGRVARSDAHCRDFGRIASHWDLAPSALAAHLEGTGMARAARFALTHAAGVTGDQGLLDVVDALAPDPLGAHIASLAARVELETGWPVQLSSVMGMLLARDLETGLSALATQMRYHAGQQLARVGPGSGPRRS